jgi:cytochrome c553
MKQQAFNTAMTKIASAALVLILVACATTPTPTAPPPPTAAPATATTAPTAVPATATTAPTAAPTVPPGVSAADVYKLVTDKFNTVDTKLTLWNIQPGLGTVMMEYSNRLSRIWFAANAGNWDMAKYQVGEMLEIQEVGETTRPTRAPMLKAFEASYLAALDKAIDAKDKAGFTATFKDTIAGCNACHTAATATNWNSFKFVEIQVPKADPAFYVDWKGGGQGNYIANPAPAATAAPAAAPTGNLDAAGVAALVDGKFNTVDTSLALWNIQPGLGTVMIEYSNRFSRLYFSAHAGNWDMAKYQLGEMLEIQEVGETTRPKRAPMLKAFEDGYLTPLDEAVTSRDAKAFDTAFANAVGGCNACHTASSAAAWKSYQFVKIQVPTADNNDYLVWAAAKPTGNYIANPPAAATSTPTAALTGTLDIVGAQALVDSKFNTLDTSLALWNIQPGLGTVMMEYGRRLAQVYYAIKAGNWDMAKYQLDEMLEIQEVGETTRPKRAPMLKAFEDGYLKALDAAITAQDKAKATAALNGAITGCNACHAAATSPNWSSFGFVQIQLPATDPTAYLKWNTAGGTGNYKP